MLEISTDEGYRTDYPEVGEEEEEGGGCGDDGRTAAEDV